MSDDTTSERLTPCASLAALGQILHQRDLFGPVRDTVKIEQKTVKHSPTDKLYDALIAILSGAHGLVEVNSRLRADPALQRAFGREACAEQSVIQETLDACSEANVHELQQALTTIYRTHSQGYQHDYTADWQVLDVDMSGLPCGPKAAFATKGYFAKQRNRRGRQLGRVLATRYQEIVVDQLFAGTTQLTAALQPLVQAAEAVLELNQQRRSRTLVRVDAGGGSLDDVNWLLSRDYVVLAKDYSAARSSRLAKSVARWYADPTVAGREVGLVVEPPTDYCRAVVRIAVRCQKAKGRFSYGVLIAPPDLAPIWALLGRQGAPPVDACGQVLAYVHAYDARGGGVESSLKADKQGLGLSKRNKKRFRAQQMVTMLSTLAHNIVIWARGWLAPQQPKLARYGIVRLVRDLFHISGRILFDAVGHIVQIVLNQAAPLVLVLADALRPLLMPAHIAISLGET
jgi:hypothetical protein